MSIIRCSDNPVEVSLEFLKRIDRDPPGTWLAQPKLNGWRRTNWKCAGCRWFYLSKHSDGPAARDMPAQLIEEFKAIPWPEDIALDCEWLGMRDVELNPEHSLHIFDQLMLDRVWLGEMYFRDRYDTLSVFMRGRETPHVRLVPCWPNPGLVDRFTEQMQNPLSEGLVVRRWDAKIIGAHDRCVDNPLILKVKFKPVPERSRA